MENYIKIVTVSTLFLIPSVRAEVNNKLFDIEIFKNNLIDCVKPYANLSKSEKDKLKSDCVAMLNKISNDIPTELNATYGALKTLTESIIKATTIIYVEKPDPKKVKNAMDTLAKDYSKMKRSFNGTKFNQGAKKTAAKIKGFFTGKKIDTNSYDTCKELFNTIADVLKSVINTMKRSMKSYEPLIRAQVSHLEEVFNQMGL